MSLPQDTPHLIPLLQMGTAMLLLLSPTLFSLLFTARHLKDKK